MTAAPHGQSTAQPNILNLSDTEFTLSSPGEDIRGRKVVDSMGEALGEIDDLLIDAEQHKVRFIRVSSGGFLGMGKTHFLIPVDAISWIEAKVVHINHDRNKFVNAPAYNPEMVDLNYYNSLYGYYDYSPFWGESYRYPAYPHYSLGNRYV